MRDGEAEEKTQPGSNHQKHSDTTSHHDETLHHNVTRSRMTRKRGCSKRNIIKTLHERQYGVASPEYMRRCLLRKHVLAKLKVFVSITDPLHTGAVVALRWSRDGGHVLSGGKHVTLHGYPGGASEGRAWLPAECFDLEWLDRKTAVLGTSTGFIALPDLSRATSHDMERPRDVTSAGPIVRCHGGSVFSVKPLTGLSEDVFYSASADRTVRLFDRRALCTCTSSRTCSTTPLLIGNMSYRALAINPANPHQFCVSHGPCLGIHDVRYCCGDGRAMVRRYDIPPFPRPRLTGSNRITHAVYSPSGTEILVNTRTVGTLLLSNGPRTERELDSRSRQSMIPASNSRERIVIREESIGNGILGETGGSLSQLGVEITNWLAERGRSECERESERECSAIIGRFTGHRNTRTILKEAAFWGDKYVVSGSDCGSVFIWNKDTNDIMTALPVQSQPVLCVAPHPLDPVLACCGLGSQIQILQPDLESTARSQEEIKSRIRENNRVLEEEGMTIPIPNSVIMRTLSIVDPGDFLAAIL